MASMEIVAQYGVTVDGIEVRHSDSIASLKGLTEVLNQVRTEHVGVVLAQSDVKLSDMSLQFMSDCLEEQSVSGVIADYIEETGDGGRKLKLVAEPEKHVTRDTFDMGLIVICRTEVAQTIASTMVETEYGALYGLWLGLQRYGELFHTAVPSGFIVPKDLRESDKKQFDYVNPLYETYQKDLERVCTDHLYKIGASVSGKSSLTFETDEVFPCEATVVIPVKNRHTTIADAIRSALTQKTDFTFNVIVVDNHSTDSTTEIVSGIADRDNKLIHIVPEAKDLGIGGCWNVAVSDSRCGKYVVQLDSDDLYASDKTLQTMVNCLKKGKYAMAVGSYKLVDFSLNDLPPGVISHKEWTDENGGNNLLRVNGLGAPRAFATSWLRSNPLPNVSYGEDYAIGLRATRCFKIGRIFTPIYLCRRWAGNSDSGISAEVEAAHNAYKDRIRSEEIAIRIKQNEKQ